MESKLTSAGRKEPVAIIHIVRFKLKSGADPTKVQEAIAQLHKMGREIDSVRSYCVGKDVGGDYNMSASFSFDDMAGYAEYLHSPIHRKVDEIGLPLLDDMISFDITSDDDPGIADRITEMHRVRYAGDEELVKLVGSLKSYTGSGFER
ncbi:hypothetical protein NM208_g2283 [Fusarium decemcellulare]|uniref:Uncharacterized protein n=1 Tax=Fusarium decemcellulare TaxID=57161 RepID=A0ACC1ST27_9HYPO|nr:hypothetical protein NM208_g2283 [Fusarium decemcellulare]